MMYRKLGRTTSQRKAMLRSLATDLLYHGKIITTETRAKEVRRVAERLITLAIKERDNYTEETVTAKVPRKDKDGKRVKQDENGKRVTVFNTVDKTIRKDNPSRLNARRKILSVLYPVTEISGSRPKMRSARKPVDMAAKMFDDIAPRYASRQGGYTRMVKIGPRRGDAAEQVIIELV
jgi:large subunit ribosomal protein L17